MGKKGQILTIICGALFLRLVLSPFGTLTLDFNTLTAWSNILISSGFQNFYNSWSDYLPGYLYILFVLGKINSVLNLAAPFNIMFYKLPAILGDIGTGFLIYKIVKEYSQKWANISASAYLFNPAVIANSTLWGQIDGLIPFFVLLSFYFLKKNLLLSALFLSFGALVKPHSGFAGPLFILILARKSFKEVLIFSLACALTFVLGFLPFTTLSNFPSFVLERLSLSANQYPYTSINAFNIWALVTSMWESDSRVYFLSLVTTGLLFLSVVFLQPYKKDNRFYGFGLSLLFLISFLFLTRIHERHLLPLFAPLAIFASAVPFAWVIYVVLSITYVLNLTFAYIWITQDFYWVFPETIVKFLSLVNLLALPLLFISIFPQTSKKFSNIIKTFFTKEKNRSERKEVKIKNVNKILLGILIFAAVTRLVNLQNPKQFYFDEVYHAYTAQEIVKGNPEAWEYSADPPEGVAYEWTHPPMAKLFMAASMNAFGINPFAWRLPGIILGVACIYLVFLLTKTLFKNDLSAILSASIFSLEGLPLTLSRIGMNDTYFIFFLLGTILFFLKNKYFWAALFLGGAIASKWTAFFVLPILGIAWVLYKRDFNLSYLWFVLLPPLIYFSSYLIFFTTGHTLLEWWHTQQQMWWYHTQLEATHPYTSPWWSWVLMLKPIWVYTGGENSNIYFSGNPIVFYLGIASVIGSIYLLLKEKSREVYFILFCYLALFLPWSVSPRIMFLYHYLPAVPFMVILLGVFLSKIWNKDTKVVVILILTIIGLSFIVNYPYWSGLEIPKWFPKLF